MFCEQAFSSNCIYFLSNIYKNVEVLSLRLALDPIKLSGLVAGQFQLKMAFFAIYIQYDIDDIKHVRHKQPHLDYLKFNILRHLIYEYMFIV